MLNLCLALMHVQREKILNYGTLAALIGGEPSGRLEGLAGHVRDYHSSGVLAPDCNFSQFELQRDDPLEGQDALTLGGMDTMGVASQRRAMIAVSATSH